MISECLPYLNGSGYPKNLKDADLNLLQKILQVADVVTSLMHGEFYQRSANEQEIVDYLQKEVEEKRLSKQVVDTMALYYGEIMEKVKIESGQILLLHKKLETQFERVYAKELNR